MPWFKRTDKGILTPTEAKREVPDGLWFKSPGGKIVHTRELKNNAYVVPEEDYHVKVGSKEYFEILFDNNEFTELDANMESGDPLKFVDTKPYPKRIKESQAKTQLKDAVRTAYGKMNGHEIVVACMDFSFIGGSMGSVVGEKIARAADHALKTKTPLLIISRSGASSLTEISIVGLPSILVPFPYAADDHQTRNAEVFERAGAAKLVQERVLDEGKLAALALSILSDPAASERMTAAARSLAISDAAERVCTAIEDTYSYS